MSCGGLCKPVADKRAKVCMCKVCAYRDACPTYVAATVRGELRIPAEAECPGGFWPIIDGSIRWLGLVWIGVPWPIRWWFAILAARMAIEDRLSQKFLSGCGCIAVLKDAVEELRGAFASAERASPVKNLPLIVSIVGASLVGIGTALIYVPAGLIAIGLFAWLIARGVAWEEKAEKARQEAKAQQAAKPATPQKPAAPSVSVSLPPTAAKPA